MRHAPAAFVPRTSLRQAIADWAKRWSTRTRAELRAIRRYPRDVRFRNYHPADEAACLGIYQSLEAGFPTNGTDNFLASLRRPDSAIVPRLGGAYLIDRIRLPNGGYQFTARDAGGKEEGD